MTVLEAAPPAPLDYRADIVNDFALVAATVNGTGSQTANLAIIRALFQMGLPVTGKNLFPSNIQGLPTWYTIRVSEAGHTARREVTEILIAFNPNTWEEDVAALPPGGVCIYNADWRDFEERRNDITYYGIPVKEHVQASGADFALRDYVANMVYVGTLVSLFDIEYDEVYAAISRHFAGKAKPIALNMGVVDMAIAWAEENLEKRDPFRVERRNLTEGLMLIDGNTAGALGSLFGGLTFAAWYPITPATSFADGLIEWTPKLRRDAQGKETVAIVQAEDELAAIGMVVGAGWAGARAVTSTSGPGISLMSEFAGLAYFAEIPSVIWDIQRTGPSTGLPTRVSQGDILSAYTLSHGDTKHVVLFPGTMRECFDFGRAALDLAEQLQTLVLVLSDLDLGMNQWMTEPFDYPDKPLERGKVLDEAGLLSVIEESGRWGRYVDVDGDGVGYRTLPGIEHPLGAYFARGTGHDQWAVYSERPDVWQENIARIQRKHETARKLVPGPIVDEAPDATVAFISLGSADPAVREARTRLAAQGIPTSYLRVLALPFSADVRDFAERYERLYVVEMNSDGQLRDLLRQEYPEMAMRFRALNLLDGLPLTAKWIVDSFTEIEAAQ
ncbi:MAG: 2-oxoacid:acceptor oxidoreductase subunit alpha [Ardenticatenales bacterium]|nr:2-oxoacid:acceptor oxidoreductase subunit alpha [Ardenticatenales bacterium]